MIGFFFEIDCYSELPLEPDENPDFYRSENQLRESVAEILLEFHEIEKDGELYIDPSVLLKEIIFLFLKLVFAFIICFPCAIYIFICIIALLNNIFEHSDFKGTLITCFSLCAAAFLYATVWHGFLKSHVFKLKCVLRDLIFIRNQSHLFRDA